MEDTILQSGQFLYKQTNNEIRIVGYTGTEARVELPDSIDGMPVTGVGYCGQGNLDGITLVLSNGIRHIEPDAYAMLHADACGFDPYAWICGVEAGSDHPHFSSLGKWLFAKDDQTLIAYFDLEARAVAIPKNVRRIQAYAFHSCALLSTVTIPEHVEYIGDTAFNENTAIHISSADTELGNNVAGKIGSPNAKGGLLLSKDGKRLIKVLAAKGDVVLPENVETIDDYAFKNCPAASVVLNHGLRKIGHHAFFYSNVKAVDIPATVEEMYPDSFQRTSYSTIPIRIQPGNPHYHTAGGILYHVEEDGSQTLFCVQNTALVRAEIPRGVKVLEGEPFADCRKLTAITLSEGLERLEESCLGVLVINNEKPVTVAIPSTLRELVLPEEGHDLRIRYRFHEDNPVYFTDGDLCYRTEPDGSYTLLFAQNRMMGEALIHQDTAAIAPHAFMGDRNGKGVFARLKTITLPAGVKTVHPAAFDGCHKLQKIEVAQGNTALAAVDGVLFTKDLRTLLIYPQDRKGKEYTLPDGVEAFGTAFAASKPLKTLRLPGSVQRIADGAFPESCGIEELYIEGSIQQIGPLAFGGRGDESCSRKEAIVVHASDDAYLSRYVKEIMQSARGNIVIESEGDSPEVKQFRKLFAFEQAEDGIRLTRYLGSGRAASELAIPAAVGGVPVVELGDQLFPEGLPLTRLIIPEGVKRIGESVFFVNYTLRELRLPASVTEISQWVFCSQKHDCKDMYLNSNMIITVPEGSYAHQFMESYKFKAFSAPTLLALGQNEHLKMELSKGGYTATLLAGETPTDRLEVPAMNRDKPVTRLVLCQGKPDDAFDIYNLPVQILSLTIPATVKWIDGIHKYRPAQKTPDGLPALIVAEDSPHFWSDGHALYTGDRKTLLFMVDDTLEEYTVCESTTAIGDYAFKRIRNLKRVTLSPNTRKLGDQCFYGCGSIEEISGLEAVEKLGANALMGTTFVKNQPMIIVGRTLVSYQGQDRVFTVPEGVETIAMHAFKSFSNPGVLEEVVLPSTIRTIGAYAFVNRKKLRRIDLPEGLETIGQDAFEQCYALESLHLPSTLSQLPPRLFRYWDADQLPIRLAAITVAEGNPAYSAQDGVLYNKDMTQLLFVPAGLEAKELRIPETVRSIKGASGITGLRKLVFTGRVEEWTDGFTDCENLAEVVFMDSCPVIPDNAFSGCKKLKKVTFPKDLQKIGNRAFLRTKLVGPELPDTLEHIGVEAFARIGIKTFTVPATVRTLGWGAFSGADEIQVYDTIEPDAKPANERVDTVNGSPNGMVGYIGMGDATASWSCAANHKWHNYTITVRSAETGDVKYKVWMGAEQSQRVYYCLLASGWGHNATFAFRELDAFFPKIRGAEHKLRVAQLRLEYPVELTDEAKKKYEAYVKKNAPKGE